MFQTCNTCVFATNHTCVLHMWKYMCSIGVYPSHVVTNIYSLHRF